MVLEVMLLFSSFLLLVMLILLLVISKRELPKKRFKIKDDIRKIREQILN